MDHHRCATMEDPPPPAAPSFPGFQSSLHRDDMEYERVLTRLQRRAPAPLPLDNKHIFPTVDPSAATYTSPPQTCPARFGSASGSGSSKKGGGGGGKQDPIPLLTPLVSPTAAGLGQQMQKQGISSLCFVTHGD